MTTTESLAFLDLIYRPALAASPGYLQIWQLQTKQSAWFRSVDEAAAHESVVAANDTYVAVGLSDGDYGPHHRAHSDQINAVPALWLDVDVLAAVHQHKDLPPNLDGARLLIEEVGLPPTVVVNTGHGLQGWWRLTDGLIESAERRNEIGAVIRAWQRLQIQRARQRHGWRIDATHDLARLMRLPGTWNCKADPVPVTVEQWADGVAYSIDDFRALVSETPMSTSSTPVRAQPTALSTHLDAEPPFEKMTALLARDRRFSRTRERTRTDLADKSPSGWDMALADAAIEAGWTDQEVANLLIAHRRKHGDDLKLREDYLAGTIQKAHVLHGNLDDLLAQAESPEDQRAVRLDYISQHVGVPVLGMIRHPGPPSTYRLRTQLGNLPLQGIADITTQARFRNHLADRTGHLLSPMRPPVWHAVAQALMEICEDDVINDLTEEGRARDWIEGYLGERDICPTAEEGEAANRSPFREAARENQICWFGDDMNSWLLTRRMERVTKREMGALLRAYGCEQVTVKLEIDGKRTTRLVWCVPNRESEAG